MSLIKIRTGINMEVLGDMFGVSATLVSNICTTWWRFLSEQLKVLIFNPEKHVVAQLLPTNFIAPPYRDVRHIIDCTEVLTSITLQIKGIVTYLFGSHAG